MVGIARIHDSSFLMKTPSGLCDDSIWHGNRQAQRTVSGNRCNVRRCVGVVLTLHSATSYISTSRRVLKVSTPHIVIVSTHIPVQGTTKRQVRPHMPLIYLQPQADSTCAGRAGRDGLVRKGSSCSVCFDSDGPLQPAKCVLFYCE